MAKSELISPAELQTILGIGRTKVYELLARGEIRSYRVGRLVRVDREDIDDFLQRNRNDSWK